MIYRRPERRQMCVAQVRLAQPLISEFEREQHVYVSDLALGPARPHHVATEFAAQLGMTLPQAAHAQPGRESAQNIELELLGDLGRLTALACAQALIDARLLHNSRLVVIAPGRLFEWGDANTALLEYLCDHARDGASQIVLVLTGQSSLPAHWKTRKWLRRGISRKQPEFIAPEFRCLAGLVPRDVSPRTAGALVARTALGARLIEPCERRLITKDEVVLGGLSVGSLLRRVCAVGARPKKLMTMAENAGRAHDLSLTRRLADQALQSARGTPAEGEVLYRVQRLRLFLGCYAEAAGITVPFAGVPAPLLRQIHAMTGYAAALDGDANVGRWLTIAVNPPGPPEEWPDLWARNTLSLSFARLGLFGQAIALQRGIRNAVRGQRHAWHLKAINALNLARAYRLAGGWPSAGATYAHWHRLIEGTALPAELLYVNLCLARLAEEMQQYQEGFLRWLRTALHWLAQPFPEAVGWRVASALLGVRVEHADPAGIAAVLTATLNEAAARVNLRAALPRAAPVFAYASELSRCDASLAALGARGLSLMGSRRSTRPSYECPANRTLRRVVASLLTGLIPGADRFKTYYLDASQGYDIPLEANEPLDSAIRHGARFILDGGALRSLSAKRRRQLENESNAKMSGAVCRIRRSRHGVTVFFKRNLAKLSLDAAASVLLWRIQKAPALRNYSQEEIVSLRRLEQMRVVRISR